MIAIMSISINVNGQTRPRATTIQGHARIYSPTDPLHRAGEIAVDGVLMALKPENVT